MFSWQLPKTCVHPNKQANLHLLPSYAWNHKHCYGGKNTKCCWQDDGHINGHCSVMRVLWPVSTHRKAEWSVSHSTAGETLLTLECAAVVFWKVEDTKDYHDDTDVQCGSYKSPQPQEWLDNSIMCWTITLINFKLAQLLTMHNTSQLNWCTMYSLVAHTKAEGSGHIAQVSADIFSLWLNSNNSNVCIGINIPGAI